MIDDLTYYTLSVQTQTRSNSKRHKERKLNKKKPWNLEICGD